MKKKVILISSLLLCFPILLFAKGTPDNVKGQAVSVDRDGSSFEKAVIIKYIGDYQKSIEQEYEYIAKQFGIEGKDWQLYNQSLQNNGNKFYDKMVIEFPSKETKTLYFDITEPFSVLNKQLCPTSN